MDLKGLVKALGYRYKDIQNQSQVQNEAMDALIQIDEPAVDLLIRTLNNEFIGPSDSDIQMRIVRILGEIGTKKVVNALIEVLDGDIKDIRYEVAMD
ncbi:MAG TPA: HEAT repeat domain-containing protein [Dictyoglomaceae bacterium]|nr:HEAT repeat domain-containing protein [Dictyoglomaceae bacterium]HPU43882.1 HEAT repeat domain-containing protein [Dictyoglomaceae bacterium]